MTASPDFQPKPSGQPDRSEEFRGKIVSAVFNRENLNYVTTVGVSAYLYSIGAQRLYDLGYVIVDKLPGSDVTILDKMRDTNTALSVLGGIVIGDVLYRLWNSRTRPSE